MSFSATAYEVLIASPGDVQLEREVAEEAIQNLIISALDHYQRAQDFLKAGDWAGYGRALDDMKRTLEELAARGGKTSPPEK